MGYEIRVLRNERVVGFETSFEAPTQDYLDELVRLHEADFCDVARADDDQ